MSQGLTPSRTCREAEQTPLLGPRRLQLEHIPPTKLSPEFALGEGGSPNPTVLRTPAVSEKTQPVPNRAVLLSGLYPIKNGAHPNN